MLVFCERERSVRDDFLSRAKAALQKETGESFQPLHNIKVPEVSSGFFAWISSAQVKQTLIICGHGTDDTQLLGGYSAGQVAAELARQKVSSAQISVIKLYSCCVGDKLPTQTQNNFAQQFVIELNKPGSQLGGVPVFAPMGLIVIRSQSNNIGVLQAWDWVVERSNGQTLSLKDGMIEYRFNPDNPSFAQGYIPPTL